MTSRKSILDFINDNSLILYCLLKSRKIKTKILYEALLTKNKDIILKKIVSVSNKKINSLKENYTKENCLDEILYLTDKKYRHLKEIRYIVNIENLVKTTITDPIYIEKLKIHYTDLIIDLLIDDFYDYKSLKKFSKLREKIIKMDSDINRKIIKNIDKFYIKKITI